MKSLAVGSLLALLALPSAGLEPYLVKDVNPVPGAVGSGPSGLFTFGGAVLFRADGEDGTDLWRSDGTAAGTFPLTQIGDSKFPPVPFLVTERLFFFLAEGHRGGQYLWVSDGTPAGTFRLADATVVPTSPVWSARQGVLYFTAYSLEHGGELWRSDGTPAGTHMVADVRPGMTGSSIRGLTEHRGRVWFGADDGQRGGALWSTDGTASGTVLEIDPVPSSAAHGTPDHIQVVGRRLTFFARTPGRGRSRQLWAGDGTARGTRPITNLSAALHDPVVHGNRLFFVAEDRRGQELWVSDGTARGTRVLTGFAKRDAFVLPGALRRQQGLPGLFGFAADDGAHGVEPWVTDGTPQGTRLLRDVCPGACSSLPGPGRTFAGRLWFAAEEGAHGRELWSTDGTAAGTRLALDVCPGDCGSRPLAFVVVGGRLLFVAGDGESGQEIWSTDGTAEGTVRVSDFEHSLLSEEAVEGIPLGAVLDGQLLFAASDSLHGHELWSTDGTAAGTRLVEDINRTDFGGSFPAGLRPLRDGIVFTVRSFGIPELWKSDGTAAGTALLATFGPEEEAGALPEGAFAEAGGLLFYFGHSPAWNRTEPWRTDGTAAGTFRLTDESVPGCCAGQEMRALGSTVFFDLWDGEHGRELWASDGTREGTRLVRDILPGSTGSDPRELTVFQGRLWFAAEGPFTGRELWTSDGTEAGTALVKDIDPEGDALAGDVDPEGDAGSAPTFLTVHAGRLWFFADDGENGRELWASDGTEAGTGPAVEFEPGPGFLEVQLMASLGDRLVISAHGQGLWATDGTPAGTRKIHDREHDAFGYRGVWTVFQGRLYYVVDGSVWSTDGTEASIEAGTGPLLDRDGEPIYLPRSFAVLGGRLLFSADDGLGRQVLWESDGTPAGTFQIEPRIVVAHPWELIRAGDRVFFPGDDRFHGTELWAVRP